MREILRDPARIEHIKEAIDRISQYVNGVSYTDFTNNSMLYYAIVKNIEIIGEAAYMLTDTFKSQHPEIEWPVIVRMRHVLVHGYYQLDADEIWLTATQNIPELQPKISDILKQIE